MKGSTCNYETQYGVLDELCCKKKSSGSMTWLIVLVVLAAALFAGWWFFMRTSTGDSAVADAPPAVEASTGAG